MVVALLSLAAESYHSRQWLAQTAIAPEMVTEAQDASSGAWRLVRQFGLSVF